MRFQGVGFRALRLFFAAFSILLFLSGVAAAAPFYLSVQASLSGPLSGVNVYAFSESGSYTGFHTTTDTSGNAQFTKEDFGDGTYRFRIDYLNQQYWSPVVTLPVDDTATATIEEAAVTVTVEDSTAALSGVNTYLFNESDAYLGLSASTDAAGQATFVLPIGLNIKVRADYRGYQFWSPNSAVVPGLQVSLQVPSHEITLTVQGSFQGQSQPMDGISTFLFKPPSSYLGITTSTDSNGTATFNLPDQTYRIRADYLEQQFWSADFNATDTTVDIPLADAQITVTGSGIGLPGVPVYVFSGAGSSLGINAVTDASGEVTFRLPAGEYKFRADYQGSQYWSGDTGIVADQTNPVTISTGGGQLTLNVLKAASEPMSGVNCYAYSDAGAYLGFTAATDADGRVNFNLADGSYKIRVDYLGYQFWTPVYAVATDISETLTIPHQDVTVTVGGEYQGSNSPLAGVPMYLFTEAGTYMGLNLTTDVDGRATFNLPERSYKVRADYLGQQFWSDPFSWQDAAVVINQGVVETTVTRSGSSVTGAQVYLFSEVGSYLGQSEVTDADGKAQFLLPNRIYKFRADENGEQAWSPDVQVTEAVVTPVSIAFATVSVTMEALPDAIQPGASATLTWTSTGADSASIDNGVGNVAASGSVTVSPATTTTYTITATGLGGTAASSATVTVIENQPPTLTILQPDGVDDLADTEYLIQWSDEDPDDNAVVTLYYDTDGSGADGTLIVDGISEDADGAGDSHLWDTAILPNGNYYIYGVINDGIHTPLVAYSSGPLTIEHTSPVPSEQKFGITLPYNSWSVVSGVDISGDNAVAAYADGSLALFNRENGTWTEQRINAVDTGLATISVKAIDWDGITLCDEQEVQSGQIIDLNVEPDFYQNIYLMEITHDVIAGDGVIITSIEQFNNGAWQLETLPDFWYTSGALYDPFQGWIISMPFSPAIFNKNFIWAGGATTRLRIHFEKRGLAASLLSQSVAIHDNLAVSVPNGLFGGGSLAANLFKRQDGSWRHQDRFSPGTPSVWGGFGASIDIADGLVVVGAPYSTVSGTQGGAVCLFTYNGAQWTEQAPIFPGNGELGDWFDFGQAVAVDGDTLVVGAPHAITDGISSGAVYIFQNEGGSWIEQAKLTPPNPTAGDSFGRSVAVSGDTVVVGAPYKNVNGITSGAAYIFRKDGSGWDVDGELSPDNPNPSDSFGYTVSIDGSHVVVGAPDAYDGTAQTGQAFVYRRSDDQWMQLFGIVPADATDNEGFGEALALSGDTIIVSKPVDASQPPNSGAVYFYSFPATTATIAANPAITADGQSTLTWQTQNATSVVIEPGIGAVDGNGSLPVTVSETTSYTITADGIYGTATDEVTVTLGTPPPMLDVSVNPETIVAGNTAEIIWSSSGATSVSIDPGIGNADLSGSVTVSPIETTAYTITASGPGGTVSETFTLNVVAPPSISLYAYPYSINPGESTVLYWDTYNADSISIDPGIGPLWVPRGSMTVSPDVTTTYTLTATGPGGTAATSVTVMITGPMPTVTFWADPATINQGQSTTLHWDASNTESVTIAGIGTYTETSGSVTISPTETTTYQLTATGFYGTTDASATVTVKPPPGVYYEYDPLGRIKKITRVPRY